MTHADERRIVDFETSKFLDRIKKMNKGLKHIQVTDVNIRINEPGKVNAKMWWQFWKKAL